MNMMIPGLQHALLYYLYLQVTATGSSGSDGDLIPMLQYVCLPRSAVHVMANLRARAEPRRTGPGSHCATREFASLTPLMFALSSTPTPLKIPPCACGTFVLYWQGSARSLDTLHNGDALCFIRM